MLIYGGWCKPYHARPGLCNTQNGRHGRDGLGPLIVSYEHPENRNRQRRGRGGRRRRCSRGASSSQHSGANICMCCLQYNRPPMTNPVTYGSSLSARSAFPLLTDFLALQSRKNAPHGFVSSREREQRASSCTLKSYCQRWPANCWWAYLLQDGRECRSGPSGGRLSLASAAPTNKGRRQDGRLDGGCTKIQL